MKGFTSTALAAAAVFASTVAAVTVDPIVSNGSKFFYKTNGTQLYVLRHSFLSLYAY